MYAKLERKRCLQCKEVKAVELFRWRERRGGTRSPGYESYCKACEKVNFQEWYRRNKHHQRKRDFERNCKKFGLSGDQYKAMVKTQSGKCAICNRPERCTRGGIVKNLAIDHCHDSDRIRALLCNGCNTAIGLIDEDLEIAKSIVRYLRKFKSRR